MSVKVLCLSLRMRKWCVLLLISDAGGMDVMRSVVLLLNVSDSSCMLAMSLSILSSERVHI